jgi:hypothetical protein
MTLIVISQEHVNKALDIYHKWHKAQIPQALYVDFPEEGPVPDGRKTLGPIPPAVRELLDKARIPYEILQS